MTDVELDERVRALEENGAGGTSNGTVNFISSANNLFFYFSGSLFSVPHNP